MRSRPFVLSEEDEIIIEQLELGALLKPTLSRLYLIVDLGKFLQRLEVKQKQTTPGLATHHDERFLHPTDDVA